MAAITLEREQRADEQPPAEHTVREIVHSIHDDLDLPEGYRAEIIGGDIVVAATPFAKHQYIVWRIRTGVEPALAPDFAVFDNTTLEEPEIDRYIPDLAAWPIALMRDTVDEWIIKAEHCAFAAEVTSPGQEARDYSKASGYARGGVPVYLIVDRKDRKCVVHTDPSPTGYTTKHEVPFGEHVTLTFTLGEGAPRSATIDTSDF